MTVKMSKIVNEVAYATGDGQYITLPIAHANLVKRAVYLKKIASTGATLDVHPIEVSVNGVDFVTQWSVDGAALNTANAEATGVSAYTFSLVNAPAVTSRIKIDVTGAAATISVWIADFN
jgi:hypothetical protein